MECHPHSRSSGYVFYVSKRTPFTPCALGKKTSRFLSHTKHLAEIPFLKICNAKYSEFWFKSGNKIVSIFSKIQKQFLSLRLLVLTEDSFQRCFIHSQYSTYCTFVLLDSNWELPLASLCKFNHSLHVVYIKNSEKSCWPLDMKHNCFGNLILAHWACYTFIFAAKLLHASWRFCLFF